LCRAGLASSLFASAHGADDAMNSFVASTSANTAVPTAKMTELTNSPKVSPLK